MTATAALSFVSDCLCNPFVAYSAKKYSDVLHTPEHFVEMLLLVEDKRFPIHFGIDPVAVVRAFIFNLQGKPLQGASTIGQQVYSIRQRSSGDYCSRRLMHKLQQSAWSLCHSTTASRASILEEYVDTVYWGRSYHGLDRATAGYFNKTRDSLSIAESFFLAERISAPNRVSTRRISNLLERAPVRISLHRNRARIDDVVALYEKIYGGGKTWELLGK